VGRRPTRRADQGSGDGSGGKLTAALRWWLDNGEQWRAAKAREDADGVEIPDDLEPPEVIEGFDVWFSDFWTLSSERQIGFGYGPIPASAIERHVAGWEDDDAEMFRICIRRMDELYMTKANSSDQPTPTDVSPRDAFRTATAGRRGQ
jgi:hypothetical protein